MLIQLIKVLFSMLVSPRRMPGRTWGTEFFRRFLRNMFEAGSTRPVEWIRERLAHSPIKVSALKKVTLEWQEVAGLNSLIIRPNGQEDPQRVIAYLHGGGYVAGSPNGYQGMLAQIALAADALIIAPDYSLSPEHPFPKAQDECAQLVRYLRERYADLPLIVAGDSAGGGLTISTGLTAVAEHWPQQPDALILISPWVEPTADSGTIHSNEPYDIFSKPFLDRSYGAHIGEGDPQNTRTNFKNADLTGLPKTYIQVAGGELLLDQINDFAERAKAQGVDIINEVYPTQFHVFQVVSPILADAREAVQKMADFVLGISRSA